MSAAPPMIESLRVRGFRSLADIELSRLPQAAVLIGPNGSGKSNVLRFLDMLRYMLRHRRLGWFVEREGGAGDQLFGGAETTDGIAAEVTLKIGCERYDYRFVLEYAHTDRLFFGEEAFRRRSNGHPAVERMAGPGQRAQRGQLSFGGAVPRISSILTKPPPPRL